MQQNAFVTGGSRGIGRGIVLEYVKRGWGVAFTYNSRANAADETIAAAKEINPAIQVKSYPMSLLDPTVIEATCENVLEDFNEIDAVVNNAAVIKDNAAALMSNEEWNEVIAANLTAPFLINRSFLMHFLSKRKGRFIQISSLSAGGSSGQINYASAKAGLVGLTRTLAKEYGKKGITANIVTVGYVPTGLTEDNMTNFLQDYWVKNCPARRVGTAEEIAAAVLFLSSDDARFVSGENLHVSAGLTYAP
ncbi:MAG: SDR family oxidoreductase [Spirochaetales bacterium]|nr:SDR family oxidoreductase [Spirochaetales bacterium]